MTRAQALKEAVRRWGKQAAVDDRGPRAASTPELRAAASAELKVHRTTKPVAVSLQDRERFPDTMTLGEYRQAVAENNFAARRWREEEQRLMGEAWRQRYSVGRVSFAFEIKGSGDSWDEAFADADRRAEDDRKRYARE